MLVPNKHSQTVTSMVGFISHPMQTLTRARRHGPSQCTTPPASTLVQRRPIRCVSNPPAFAQSGEQKDVASTTSTEDVFAIDAGRDLFFSGLDEEQAIQLLDVPLGELNAKEDRFIAAERLKFFVSSESTQALMRFVRAFDPAQLDDYILEDRVSRRKAVESLGRHKGAFHADQVVQFLVDFLQDPDASLVETVVWSLGEIGATLDETVLRKVMQVLDSDDVDKRVVIRTLLRAKFMPAVDKLRRLTDDTDVGIATAAMAAVYTMTNEADIMRPVVDVLKSEKLIERRSAIEDITLSKFVPALQQVAVCPNSLVLRARTVRVLLDAEKVGDGTLDTAMAHMIDRLIWDHPDDLDLLGMKKETRKSRNVERNVRQLYKNDALFSYLACRTLAEDHRDKEDSGAAAAVHQSYKDLPYFDYFGAYHVYKTLGWLRYAPAYDLLLENAASLPPRFFNHKAGAVTALAEMGNMDALPTIQKVALETTIWELKYACLITSERLGDGGNLRRLLQDDSDWLISARCRCKADFSHLKSLFEGQQL